MSTRADSPPSALTGSLLARVDSALGWLVALPAAVLVAVEVVLLFTGVIARYVFHKPLIIADELSSVLFLWLAMMGAAVALHRNAHMRMTALVNGSGDLWCARWDWAAWAACLCFLALLAEPSIGYLLQQREIELPGLSISDGWRAAAMPVATLLMIVITLVKLLMRGTRETLSAALIAIVLAGALQVIGPVLADLGNLNLVIFFIGVVGTAVMLGMPIAFAFGLATFSYLSLSTSMPLDVVVGRVDEGVSHLILLAVPMFVFLGLVVEMTGMARTMVAFLASLLGHVRGGLSYVLVGSMYLTTQAEQSVE